MPLMTIFGDIYVFPKRAQKFKLCSRSLICLWLIGKSKSQRTKGTSKGFAAGTIYTGGSPYWLMVVVKQAFWANWISSRRAGAWPGTNSCICNQSWVITAVQRNTKYILATACRIGLAVFVKARRPFEKRVAVRVLHVSDGTLLISGAIDVKVKEEVTYMVLSQKYVTNTRVSVLSAWLINISRNCYLENQCMGDGPGLKAQHIRTYFQHLDLGINMLYYYDQVDQRLTSKGITKYAAFSTHSCS